MPWTAAAIAGAGALGAGSSLLGSGKASSASKQAANTQLAMYNTTRGDLAPFRAAGAAALPTVNSLITPGANMDQTLRYMPGYQFTLDQGQKATQAAAAARGLGVSGASLKGAATYATGLSDQYYQQMFKDALDTASMGANAAAITGQAGTQAAGAAGNFLNQAGIAGAAGVEGVGSAATGAVNNYLQYSLLKPYLQQIAANQAGGTLGYPTGGATTPAAYQGGVPQLPPAGTYPNQGLV